MSYKSRLAQIKAFVFDVDGVFTDGSVYLLPEGHMSRVMNVLDGYAVVKAVKNKYPIGVITGGDDAMVKHRINYLGVTDYYPKSADKIADFEDFAAPGIYSQVLWSKTLTLIKLSQDWGVDRFQ